jgi:hypothetical protein
MEPDVIQIAGRATPSDAAIEKVASLLGTVQTQRQKHLAEMISLVALLKELPDPSKRAWENLQKAYQVQAAQWDSESEKDGPDATVRAKLDLALLSRCSEAQDVEHAMEVLLIQWDNGVLGRTLESTLSAAIDAEASSSARMELVRILQTTAKEEVNSRGSRRLDSSAVHKLVQECDLEDLELETRLHKALGVTSNDTVSNVVRF